MNGVAAGCHFFPCSLLEMWNSAGTAFRTGWSSIFAVILNDAKFMERVNGVVASAEGGMVLTVIGRGQLGFGHRAPAIGRGVLGGCPLTAHTSW